MRFNTKLLHGNKMGDANTGATLTPVYQSSAFYQPSAEQHEKLFHNKATGFSYTRINNPTIFAFEERMTTDFERMGDEIRNAAKGVRKLSELVKPLSEPALANVSTLFSLHALLRVMGDDMIACVRLLDPERARALVARRTIVSAEVDEALSDTVERLKTGELKLADGLEFIRINRSLERVAAHMQNVGETVVFMTEGVDIRHAGKTQPQQN
jgi:phosphate uptake regulator